MDVSAVTTSFTKPNTGRRIWSMNSKYEEMKAASKQNLQEASDTPTMVYVSDSNWQATIAQLKLLTEMLLEVEARTDQTMTAEQMKQHLRNQKVIFDQVLEKSEEIQKQTSQNVTAEVSNLQQSAKDLSSQAGKLNEQTLSQLRCSDEQTLSQLRCSDEQNRKKNFRLLTAVAVIELLQPDIIGGIAAVASIIEDEPADGTEYAREHVERNGNVTLLE